MPLVVILSLLNLQRYLKRLFCLKHIDFSATSCPVYGAIIGTGGIEMSIKNKIVEKIKIYNSGIVFISNDFLDIASNETVRRTLNRLVKDGSIKRIIDGFYYKPAYSTLIE